jgi:hypothetical protein
LASRKREIIQPNAQDNYSELLKPMLSDSHVHALAALFGWEVGDGGQVRASDVLTIM